MRTTYKTEVTQDRILGERTPADNLYMVVWQRLANSGINYVWANDEEDALQLAGWNPEFVKHTVVKIDPESMPVEAGVRG